MPVAAAPIVPSAAASSSSLSLTSNYVTCATMYSLSSVNGPIPTTTITRTLPAETNTMLTTSASATQTVTPKASTLTSTVTSTAVTTTTLSALAGSTFSTTSVVYSTTAVAFVNTLTQTALTTTTSSVVSTSTIAAPTAFNNIDTTTGQSSSLTKRQPVYGKRGFGFNAGALSGLFGGGGANLATAITTALQQFPHKQIQPWFQWGMTLPSAIHQVSVQCQHPSP